jgi:hypothetical protein
LGIQAPRKYHKETGVFFVRGTSPVGRSVGAVPRRQGRGNVAQAAGPEGSIPNFIHVSAGKTHEVMS